MKTKIFKSIGKATRKFFDKHGSQILTGAIIVGSAATVVLTVEATKKSIEILEEEKEKTGLEKIPAKEVVKLVGKEWIPTAATFVATASSAIGLYKTDKIKLNKKQMLIDFYDEGFSKYRKKVAEKYGKEASESIQKEIIDDDIKESAPCNGPVIEVDRATDTWVYEPFSRQWFWDNYISVMETKNKFNDMMLNVVNPYMQCEAFSTLLFEFGIDDWQIDKLHFDIGDEFGFRTGHLCDYHLEETVHKGRKSWEIVYTDSGCPIRDYHIYDDRIVYY